MSAGSKAMTRTREVQEQASNPAASAWVSANAGTGKTTVLVRRVIRLLLAGHPPARILCLTFTKAAAANMANKVLKKLSEWVRLDDAALDRAIAEVSPLPPTPELRARARRLFAAALETPGGLKVQTIHAFCDRVLHQFPFEAGVPAGFEVLDEMQERDLLARARQSVLIDAAAEPEGPLGRALAQAVAAASDMGLEEALTEAVRERGKVLRAAERNGDATLAAALALDLDDTAQAIDAEILNKAGIARSEWSNVAGLLQSLGGRAKERGTQFAAAASSGSTEQAVQEYLAIYFTDKGKPRGDGDFGKRETREAEPELFTRLMAERDRLVPLRDKRLAAQARERTNALLALAAATIRRYQTQKRARGALDYADLIERTAEMLNQVGSSWVLYKLDGGIDHVLIDEAQDTSPEQWQVIAKLTEEFFAGRGAREDRMRTVFAVGDEKQSIFGFQGADPKEFGHRRHYFARAAHAAEGRFHDLRLDLSFRSAPGVLKAIDTVFARPEAFRGLSSGEEQRTAHEAIRTKAPALVEIWLTEKPDDDPDDEMAWDAPLDARSEASAVVRLARRIAAAVQCWLGGALAIADRESGALRAPRAGDVIVLVRRRGPLFESILQALKQAGLPVAGADRLLLTEHIAVMDLMALGDALLLQADDHALACVLKSPLIGLCEDELFTLAYRRQGSLAAALAGKAQESPRLREAAAAFARWRAEAAELRPFDFYSRVLGRDEGRKRMLARLGTEAADALDEFLACALDYERSETPSLPGFLAFLRRAGTEVKRDLEVESEAVRVMTVHGAKGLEAPIVVLADTTSMPDGRHDDRLLPLPVPDAPPDREALVWALGKQTDSARLGEARQAARALREAEYRRLLYVALTRAADALVVCGHEAKRAEPPESCWYRLVFDALDSAQEDSGLAETTMPYGDKVWRWRPEAARSVPPAAESPKQTGALPSWLTKPVPAEPARPVQKAPSRQGIEQPVPHAEGRAGDRPQALRRGELVHQLLQFLPGQAPDLRQDVAGRFLDAAAKDLPPETRAALANEAFAVLDHPDMADLFGTQSRAEVEIVARLPGMPEIEIFGRIDRLVLAPDSALIVDFKTDAAPPKNAAAVPSHYVRQLALYRAGIQRIFPHRAVRAILVFTVGPARLEIGESLLDAAFRSLTTR